MKGLIEFINEKLYPKQVSEKLVINKNFTKARNDKVLDDILDIIPMDEFKNCKQVQMERIFNIIVEDANSLEEQISKNLLKKELNDAILDDYIIYQLTDDMIDTLTGGDPEDIMNFDDDSFIETDHISVCVAKYDEISIIGYRLWTDSDYIYSVWISTNKIVV